jgi:hypothetical protein
MAISAAANPPGGVYGAAFLLPGLGLFGILRRARKKRTLSSSNIFWISTLGVMLLATLFVAGCGGSGSKSMPQSTPQGSQSNIVVTATAGSLSHSSTIAVTIQ